MAVWQWQLKVSKLSKFINGAIISKCHECAATSWISTQNGFEMFAESVHCQLRVAKGKRKVVPRTRTDYCEWSVAAVRSTNTCAQSGTKFKPNPNRNPTTKQHAVVNIQLKIVACPTYPDKFIRDNVVALFNPNLVVIVTLPFRTGSWSHQKVTRYLSVVHITAVIWRPRSFPPQIRICGAQERLRSICGAQEHRPPLL